MGPQTPAFLLGLTTNTSSIQQKINEIWYLRFFTKDGKIGKAIGHSSASILTKWAPKASYKWDELTPFVIRGKITPVTHKAI